MNDAQEREREKMDINKTELMYIDLCILYQCAIIWNIHNTHVWDLKKKTSQKGVYCICAFLFKLLVIQ